MDEGFGGRDWDAHPPYVYPAYKSTTRRGPTKPLVPLRHTLSEVTGPVYGHDAVGPLDHDLTRNAARNGEPLGERIVVTGRVLDEDGRPVRGTLIEVWQANAAGIYPHPADRRSGEVEPGFRGWARVISDFDTGLWGFDTVKPGRVPGRSGRTMAPHLNLWIVARGINIGLNTRMYFDDESEANEADPVLNLIEHIERRRTLLARRETRDGAPVYRFDIRLQGDGETVFLDV